MSEPPEPTQDTPPANQSGGFNFGDLTSQRDINVTISDSAGRDKIENTNIFNFFKPSKDAAARLAQRNRQTMLLKVKAYWIDGVLANSLHSKIIPLDMERKPDAVTQPRPWDMLWQHRDQSPQPLPPGTRIIDRFNYAAGDALLILGEPGSGKTTMLLELAKELLAFAEQNETLRIPVVFSLSSWLAWVLKFSKFGGLKQLPLTDWFIFELQTLYLIPKWVAQMWVEQDDILPLLDGLDEIEREHRADCIKAINAYRVAQGIPLVVCSRTSDYEMLGKKLLMSDALILQPLTPTKIDEYLAARGSVLDNVRHALRQDETLQEMAQSPLLLSIMVLAYRDQPPEQFKANDPIGRRHRLFASYVKQMLSQRRREREDKTVSLHQLSYLAYQMTKRQQVIFLIERIQSDWLTTDLQERRYIWIALLIWGLVLGAVTIPLFELTAEVLGTLLLAYGLLTLVLMNKYVNDFVVLETISNNEMKNPFRRVLRFRLIVGIVVGASLWLILGHIEGLSTGLGVGLILTGTINTIQRYALRFLLHHYKYLPWKLVPFLDLAAERLILQKVGSGYQFVHRMLQEYLASLYVEKDEES